MSAIFDEDADAETARRRWNAYLAVIDAEIADEARQRARFTTDIGKAIDAKPSPFIVDCGADTTRADRDAIQREQDRWTRLEELGR